MPEILQTRAGRKSIRIWCAACSTGQEPYSLAMCLKEMSAALAGWRIEIIATDLSQEVLEKSRAGIYSQFEVQRGLPIQMLVKYFKQIGELWQINADIRAMVQHRQLNLLHDFFQLGTFDVIFCRNVLIYFDQTRTASSAALPGRSNPMAIWRWGPLKRSSGSPRTSSPIRIGAGSTSRSGACRARGRCVGDEGGCCALVRAGRGFVGALRGLVVAVGPHHGGCSRCP